MPDIPVLMVNETQRDAIRADREAIKAFLTETAPENVTMSDVKDMVSDLVDCFSQLLDGVDQPAPQ